MQSLVARLMWTLRLRPLPLEKISGWNKIQKLARTSILNFNVGILDHVDR